MNMEMYISVLLYVSESSDERKYKDIIVEWFQGRSEARTAGK